MEPGCTTCQFTPWSVLQWIPQSVPTSNKLSVASRTLAPVLINGPLADHHWSCSSKGSNKPRKSMDRSISYERYAEDTFRPTQITDHRTTGSFVDPFDRLEWNDNFHPF